MANYLVGPDNSSFFKGRTTWDLLPAMEAAQDGDTIELQNNFVNENEEKIFITKNIEIVGDTSENDQGQTVLPTITGRFFIEGGAKVNLKNIYIQSINEKVNTLNISENSTLIANNLIVENVAQTGENYPIIYIQENSSVELSNTEIRESKIRNDHSVYVMNSTFDFRDSILNAKLYVNNSKVTCNNVNIKYHKHAIMIEEKANVILKNCSIDGGNVEKDWPCLWCEDSTLEMSHSTIFQANYSASLRGINSNINLSYNRIDSGRLLKCKVKNRGSVFVESLFIEGGTEFTGDVVSILGRDNGKINLYANSNAKVKVDKFWFGKITHPNIKLNRNVDFDVKEIYALEYDVEKEDFVINDNKKYNIMKTEMKTEYFGEKNAYEQLNDMTGLRQVKSEVTEFVAMAQMNKSRKNKGLHTSKMTLHSLFLGNPGTGKTTVARIVGRLLYEKGIISSKKFVETSRSDLVGRYVGETAEKTKKILDSALGGVLFIDEAYALATGGTNDFGIEAVNEILKFMEDHREDIVIIFAGYTDSMQKFLDMNEGLKSRIPNVFHFEDYTVEELNSIGLAFLEFEGYKVNKEAYLNMIKHNFELTDDHSNGRWIRNINEKLIKKLAVRLLKDNKADLSLISIEDINATKL